MVQSLHKPPPMCPHGHNPRNCDKCLMKELLPASPVVAALFEGAQTFSDRNKIYGNSFLKFGPVMKALMPLMGTNQFTEDDWNRLGVVWHCVDKLMRYCQQLPAGGHKDSARDLTVYAAILSTLTKGD